MSNNNSFIVENPNISLVDYKEHAIEVLKNDVWLLLDVLNDSDTRIASDFWNEVKSIKERHRFYGYKEKQSPMG